MPIKENKTTWVWLFVNDDTRVVINFQTWYFHDYQYTIDNLHHTNKIWECLTLRIIPGWNVNGNKDLTSSRFLPKSDDHFTCSWSFYLLVKHFIFCCSFFLLMIIHLGSLDESLVKIFKFVLSNVCWKKETQMDINCLLTTAPLYF